MASQERPAIFWRIETDDVLRIWTGPGLRHLPQDSIETQTGGANYIGIGLIMNVPDLDLLFNGEQSRFTLTLNGCSQRLIDLVDVGAEEIEGRDMNMAIVYFDDAWQISEVLWFQDYVIETIVFDTPTTDDLRAAASHNPTIVITCGSGDGYRRRPVSGHWQPDQAKPGDRGFDEISKLNDRSTRIFPPPGK